MNRLKCERVSLFVVISVIAFLSVRFDAFPQNTTIQSTTLQKMPDTQLTSWTSIITHYENKTHSGDIIVENGTYLIESMEFHLFGRMSVRQDATVIARDATLVLSPQGGVDFREAIVLENKSEFIAENLTIIFQPLSYDGPYIAVDDEAQLNMTNSKLSGYGFIIARHNATVYMENATLEGPQPTEYDYCGVITEDNSFARIHNSKIDVASARGESSILILKSIIQPRGVSAGGNGTIEIENSDTGYCQWLFDNSNLRIANSTIEGISFGGAVLRVQDSQIKYGVRASGNCVAWLIGTSVSGVSAQDTSTIWLINSAAKEIKAWDEAQVNVGWQLPVLGTLTVPYTWMPILQAAFVIVTLIVVIAVIVLINKRWKQWQTEKIKRGAISARAPSLQETM